MLKIRDGFEERFTVMAERQGNVETMQRLNKRLPGSLAKRKHCCDCVPRACVGCARDIVVMPMLSHGSCRLRQSTKNCKRIAMSPLDRLEALSLSKRLRSGKRTLL
jgi:hypothetical protein